LNEPNLFVVAAPSGGGKTSLIRALTGTETDRLKEEKERGITIELGFASLDLPGGQHLGIVDVPGHEKFVKNMVAGATGIDIVAMVIAADEGVMPQTREHMEICTLLGVKHGLVVMTKIDMVDEEWLELAIDDIQGFMQGTFLEDAPIIPVSSVTGEGIPDFVKALDDISRIIPERSPSSLFRLPVDRVFTMKGFGTVITGTLVSGTVKVGETIEIFPTNISSKVRGIQVHNQGVNEAGPGMRTAINFQGLDKEIVKRGDVLSNPGGLKPNYMVDIEMHYLESNRKPVKSRTRVRLHTGTSEVLGKLILLEQEELAPGATTVAQLRLDAPVALVKEDRFVIRSYSPVRTIGGGQVLNPIPPKHKRFKAEIIDGLKGLVDKEPEDIIAYCIEAAGYNGVTFADLKIMTNLTDKQLDANLQGLLSRKNAIQTDKETRRYVHQKSFDTLQETVQAQLSAYHEANPLKPGMPKEELKSKFPQLTDGKLFNLALNQLLKDKGIDQEENTIRLTTHSISLGTDQADIRDKMLKTYQETALQPPYFRDVSKGMDADLQRVKDVMLHLVDEGLIIKTKDDLYFDTKAINQLKAKLVQFLETNEEITTPQFKEMTGASRKYVIPLIEYFDATKVTLRVGDSRKLRRR